MGLSIRLRETVRQVQATWNDVNNHHRFRAFKHHRWKSVSIENRTGVLTQVEGGSGKVDGAIRELMMLILNPHMSKRSGAFPLKVKLGADFNLKTFGI